MAINDSAVVPLYQQVKDDIRAAIESGKYKTNEKIPPEPELSAEYSVSRITVRRAVEDVRRVSDQNAGARHLCQQAPHPPQVYQRQRNCQLYGDLQGVRHGAGRRLLNRQIVPVRKDEEAFFHVGPDACSSISSVCAPPMASRYFWRTCSCPTSLQEPDEREPQ